MNNQITLYLADDHQMVIDGLKLLINNELNVRIVGTSNDRDIAYNELQSQKPDIAIIDLKMPFERDGLILISSLRKLISTKFIVLSMYSDRRYIADAISYGASAYLLKNAGKMELITCIHKVAAGEVYFPVDIDTHIHKHNIFTPREIEILRLIIDGHTSPEIANILSLSQYTVDTHRKNICRKANTKTVLGLSKFILNNKIEL